MCLARQGGGVAAKTTNGTGKIRPLARKSSRMDEATRAYSLDKLKVYASVENEHCVGGM